MHEIFKKSRYRHKKTLKMQINKTRFKQKDRIPKNDDTMLKSPSIRMKTLT